MVLDPEHDDVSGGRHTADERSDASFDWVDELESQTWRETVYERLLTTTAMVTADGQAYLESIPRTPRAEKVLLDWCVHLVERLGGRGALLMVSYYRRMGWVGYDAHKTIHERIVSFSAPSEFEDAPTEEDHLESFSYIVRLASMDDDDD
ncbi:MULTISPECIES: FlaD/FlaE family flagellar protein [Haloferax]|uniref:Fla cluster protein FlaD2 n=2 Tax=Haloferax TaxID=2251 RepID=A0A6G1Z4G5_9EURY|nr:MULTISPECIES: FlaD/FlaE family flagellar protein [Haloferax]KAB1188728.1 fla cluster protein FlaD2 [Haloferax sp. CBA1149]MRW81440.1 fla cluster protein FlaD2 [Haloferax marinisediminis]